MSRNRLTAVVLILFASAASAQIYTWKDASGRVHYADNPPPGVNAQPVRGGATVPSATPAPASQSGAAASTPAAAGAKTWAEKDLEYRQRKVSQSAADEEKRKADETKAEKTRYCEGLQRNVSMLERGGRVAQLGGSGEREFLSDEQMKVELERVRTQLARDCR